MLANFSSGLGYWIRVDDQVHVVWNKFIKKFNYVPTLTLLYLSYQTDEKRLHMRSQASYEAKFNVDTRSLTCSLLNYRCNFICVKNALQPCSRGTIKYYNHKESS